MVSALVTSQTKRLQQPRWTEGNSVSVPSSLLDADFQDEVQLLDRNEYTSVTTALAALNKHIVDLARFYFVFSKRRQALYLLWPTETTEQEAKELITRLSVAEVKTMAKGMTTRLEETSYDLKKYNLEVSEAQGGSDCISEASTADTAPDQIDFPERKVRIDAPCSIGVVISNKQINERKALERKIDAPTVETSLDRTRVRRFSPETRLAAIPSLPSSYAVDNSLEHLRARVSPSRKVLERKIDAPIVETSDDRTSVRRVSPDTRPVGTLSSPSDNGIDMSLKQTTTKIVERVNSNFVHSPCATGEDDSITRTKANFVDRRSSMVLSSPRDDFPTILSRNNFVSPERTIARMSSAPCTKIDETLLEQTNNEFLSEPVRAKVITPTPASSATNLTSPRSTAPQPTACAHSSARFASKPSNDVVRASLLRQTCKAPSTVQNGKHHHESFRATEVALAATGSNASMTIEDLQMDQLDFDPNRPQMKTQLLNKLGLPESAAVERLEDNAGSFNDGVWIVSDSSSVGLVLKLVPPNRVHVGRKTDTEKYIELQKECPKIASDLSITFPVKILQLTGPSGKRYKDLLVMRQAPGLQITQHLYHKFHSGRTAELLTMCENFGKFLRGIHGVYVCGRRSMQHGDCSPSNVFYDEASGNFTLVDVADFGFGPFLAQGGEDDVEHFVDGLSFLKTWYGESLMDACGQHFRKGYNEGSNRE